jgi:polysaccharide pyruvyl transferase CsaB
MADSDRPVRIGISGSYGGLNLGDEAILHSIVKQIRESLTAEITVFTRDPADTKARHGVERVVQFGKQTREEARAEVQRFDLLILGGGGILYDQDVEMYLREVALANEEGVPVVVYAVSAGPLKQQSSRELVHKHLTPAAVISVRDRQGLKLLEDVGIAREIKLTADPALLLEPDPPAEDMLKSEGLDAQRRLVGFSVREPGPAAPDMDVGHYHALLANTADFMVDRLDAEVVFIPMEHRKIDVQHSHAVVAQMQFAQRARVLKAEYSSAQLLALLGHFQFTVGMRLHFLIFSALQGVPFVALPYATKVEGFIEDLEMPMPPLKQVTTGRLIAHIDRCWDQQETLRERIQRRLPALQQRARETHKIVMQVLSEAEPLRRKRRGAA